MKTVDPATLQLAAIVETSGDAIISHALDGAIDTWNRAAERLYGHPAADAVGRSIDITVPAGRRAEEARVLARVRAGEAVGPFVSDALTRDGAAVPVSVSISPVLSSGGEIASIARIVRQVANPTAFLQPEGQFTQGLLEREAFRLAAIVDSSEDAIVSKDLNGVVQTWNRAAERMFGYSAAEMVGRPIAVIIPADKLAEEDEVLARVRDGRGIDHFETMRRRKDGTFVEISLSVSPIRTNTGQIIGASKIARDITLQRQLTRAVEEANRFKDEFLATLSHELRTPLNAVLGYTRLLRMGHFREEQQDRAIETIERNASIVSRLVSDVLDVSAIVTGKVRLKLSACDLALLVDAALDSIRPSTEAKGLALTSETPSRPVTTRCDADRMQQVLWNLLSNAVKFTPTGGAIHVRVSAAHGTGTVTVTDSGAGIRPEAIPHVFQRFWQSDPVGTTHSSGLGLGLSLARHFVELHGGTIVAASPGEGRGATFTITLPADVD